MPAWFDGPEQRRRTGSVLNKGEARNALARAIFFTAAAIEQGAPALAEAQTLVDRFQSIIQRKIGADLAPWLQDAGSSLIASFAPAASPKILPPCVLLSPSRGRTA